MVHLHQSIQRPASPDAEEALRLLQSGNLNYLLGSSASMENARRAAQRPTATVVTCSYACVSPGVITHTNAHGETFVVTSSGHLPSDNFLASVNYGVVHLRTPIVFVISHKCQRNGECRIPFQDGDKLQRSRSTLEDVQNLLSTDEVQFETLVIPAGEMPSGTFEHDLGTVKKVLEIPEVKIRVDDGRLMVVTAYYNDETGQLWPTSKIYVPNSTGDEHPGEEVLRKVCSGNDRFREIYKIYKSSSMISQTPLIAMVLACSDSREVPEIMFQAPFGSVEVVRNAGASADSNALRSLRKCHEHTKVNLLVIKPHTRCGAIEAARKEHDDGHKEATLGSHLHLTRIIRPNLDVDGWANDHPLLPSTPENEDQRNRESFEAARLHGIGTVRSIIFSDNPDAIYLREQVESGGLRIVVGIARLGSGRVDFIEGEDLKALNELHALRPAVGNEM